MSQKKERLKRQAAAAAKRQVDAEVEKWQKGKKT